jgi:glyoxylase-like metal-dependent hydrolase (beta-lactamase superfamily II)
MEESLRGGTVSSVYIIVHKGCACVIDTGRFKESFFALTRVLNQYVTTLKYIILTHDHFDHVGNAERLRGEFGGEILAHSLDATLIANPLCIYDNEIIQYHYGANVYDTWRDMGYTPKTIAAMRKTTERLFNVPLQVDQYITEECMLDLNGLELRLLHTPGHSPGSLSVYVPASRSIYTGDLTFWVNPCRPYPIGNADKCVSSLERIRALGPRFCGHGHYLGIHNPLPRLNMIIGRHRTLERDILALLDTPLGIADLRARIFPDDPADSFAPIPENSIHAWLISLMHRNRIVRMAGRNTVRWRKA